MPGEATARWDRLWRCITVLADGVERIESRVVLDRHNGRRDRAWLTLGARAAWFSVGCPDGAKDAAAGTGSS
jgi:hypothetical protein